MTENKKGRVNRQCQECGGYEFDNGGDDVFVC